MEEKILEAFNKLPDKHAYLNQITGKHETNPDLWVKQNILQSPEPVQQAFYKQLTEDYEKIAKKIEAERKEREWEIACKQMQVTCLKKLQETDWTQLADAPVDQKERKAYRKYREYLRKKYKQAKQDKYNGQEIGKIQDYKDWKRSYDLYN